MRNISRFESFEVSFQYCLNSRLAIIDNPLFDVLVYDDVIGYTVGLILKREKCCDAIVLVILLLSLGLGNQDKIDGSCLVICKYLVTRHVYVRSTIIVLVMLIL